MQCLHASLVDSSRLTVRIWSAQPIRADQVGSDQSQSGSCCLWLLTEHSPWHYAFKCSSTKTEPGSMPSNVTRYICGTGWWPDKRKHKHNILYPLIKTQFGTRQNRTSIFPPSKNASLLSPYYKGRMYQHGFVKEVNISQVMFATRGQSWGSFVWIMNFIMRWHKLNNKHLLFESILL